MNTQAKFAGGRILFLIMVILSVCLIPHTINAQKKASNDEVQSVPKVDNRLDELLKIARKSNEEYAKAFNNLTCEESKIIEFYDRESGALDKRRKIVSDLIIFQTLTEPKLTSELRNVREVDDKPVEDHDKRTQKLIEKLTKSKNADTEIKLIKKESQRYDDNVKFDGQTYAQAIPLTEGYAEIFKYEPIGTDVIEGEDVTIVKYSQVVQSPNIDLDISIPGELKPAITHFQGQLWIDSKTGRLWREEREVAIESTKLTFPLIVQRSEFEYTKSPFGILVPKQFAFMIYGKVKRQNGKVLGTNLTYKAMYNYSSYSQYKVTSVE